MKTSYFAVVFGLLLFTNAIIQAADPVLSEIMPSNARILADEDGDFPDWVEIKNPGPGAVNLAGYYLTDDPALLPKWSFPATNLPAGGYLVVFASGKNRTANPALLHTSFSLDAGGGYIAIVKPDGITVASAFVYPNVKEDVAFGTSESISTTALIQQNTSRLLVPTSAPALPGNWNLVTFNPGPEWITTAAGLAVGFDTNRAVGAPVNVATSGSASQSTINGSFTPNLAINNNLADFTHTLGADPAPFWQVTLTNEMSIFSIVLYNRTSCCGSRLRDITVEILSTNASGLVTNWTSALLNAENAGFSYPNGPASISNNLVNLTGGPVSGRIVRVRRTPDADLSGSGGQGNTDEANVLSLAEVVINASAATGLRPYFNSDIETAMLGVNASAFIRTPFTISETPDALALKVRYDDGFVAYLNGVEVARRNAVDPLGWDSVATANRNFASASTQETIDLSSAIPLLTPGANLLAIHAMNNAATNADFLFQAELEASSVIVTANVFFDDATPGAANTTGFYLAEVADTHFSVDRGFFEAPFSLSITSGTPDAVIYYSFNGDEPGPSKGQLYTGPITITNTTVVRTRAFKENWKATDVDTATYLFLDDVIRQVPNWPQDRIPPRYFPTNWGANAVDYGMDPNVVSRYTTNEWREALKQIPTMSIVTEMRHLFDPTTGIYANAVGHGEEWERPMSIELLDPTNAVPGRFQENGGLRIRGGASRGASFYKHSFRVFFNRNYGATTLRYPLFGEDGAQYFDKIDLRTSQNYSWPRGESPTFDTMVREVFGRETLGAMGQPYRRSRYYHLYLNGHYWGLYETDERPSAYYGEAYFGGNKDNYDVVRNHDRYVTPPPAFSTEATDGTLTAWSNLWVMTQIMRTNATTSNYFRILGRNADGVRDASLPVMIEADNLIDYMLGIFFTGDGDATLSAFLSNNQPNNWYGMRDRTNPDVGFRFFNNDCEHTLGSPSSQVNRTGPFPNSNEGNFTYSNPQWMHEALSKNLEYRVRFGDRVQKHFFNGGALTLEASTNRFIAKASQITKAIRAYSARWGDATFGANTTNFYGEADWTNAIAFCLNWFPPRANIVLGQLRAFSYGSLFPNVGAPSFSQLGGTVPDGYPLSLNHTNAAGTLYFTIDGSDPRLIGGGVNPNAQAYSSPIEINGPLYVRARVLNGTNWSAIVEGLLSPPQDLSKLQLTEIMYNPPRGLSGTNIIDGDEYEFLEFKNAGTNTLNLSGLRFTSGITYQFPIGASLAPGQFYVIARNFGAFTNKYPGVTLRGIYSGRLDNAGEQLRLASPVGGAILSVTYNDRAPWPVTADGSGFSVVPVNPNANPDANEGRNWRNSTLSGGSPGADDPLPTIAPVLVNEVLTATVPPDVDVIELFNPGTVPVDLSGWYLSDNPSTPNKYRIADGTVLAAGAFLTFTEAQFNANPLATNSFSLRAEGDQIYLFSADAAGNLTGFSHGFSYGASDIGATFGRYVTSTGEENLPTQISPSLGGANSGPKIGPVVINEIQYHPEFGGDEFIELRNISGAAVALFDPATPTNTWRINGAGFNFPQNVTLDAGGYLIVARADPAAFRTKYNVPAQVPVYGPYAGDLQDSGELLELQKPGRPDTNGPLAYITVDAVRYNDKAPWPPAADGSGPSLQRKNALAYGNDPINWDAALITPGAPFTAGEPPVITQQPANLTAVASFDATFTVAATGNGPIFYQWRRNGANLPGATGPTLTLQNLVPAQAGNFTVLVFNSAGSVESAPAVLTILLPPSITVQPTDRSIYIKPDTRAANLPNGTNVSFSILATSGNSGVSYQWRVNGTNIPGATATTLTVTNVQLTSEGLYDCAVSDSIATVYSRAAKLLPMFAPVIITRPADQTVAEGSPFTMSVEVIGNPPPYTYLWRRNLGSLLVNSNQGNYTTNFVTTTSQNAFLLLTNGIVSSNFGMRIIVQNFAFPSGSSTTFNVTVLADTDRDGIPDSVEQALGLDTNNVADAFLDLDGDGMNNRAEYIAGTNPADPESYLKIAVARGASPGTAQIEFAANSNRTYTVQCTDELGAGPWSSLRDFTARTNNAIHTIIDPMWTSNRAYRVVTPRQ